MPQLPSDATLFSKQGVLGSFLFACALAAGGLGLMIWTLGDVDDPVTAPDPRATGGPEERRETLLSDSFEGEALKDVWRVWRCVGPKRGAVGVVNGGLRLGVATHRAEERGLYLVGVRTKQRFPAKAWLRVRASLDWRPTGNNSYRTAGLLLSGAPLDAGPTEQRPAVWLEVVGVPPGRNARLYGAVRLGERERPLFEDGWPDERTGRAIGKETLEIELRSGKLVMRENGREVATAEVDLGPQVWVALYTTSQANFMERPVVFEQVTVEASAQGQETP